MRNIYKSARWRTLDFRSTIQLAPVWTNNPFFNSCWSWKNSVVNLHIFHFPWSGDGTVAIDANGRVSKYLKRNVISTTVTPETVRTTGVLIDDFISGAILAIKIKILKNILETKLGILSRTACLCRFRWCVAFGKVTANFNVGSGLTKTLTSITLFGKKRSIGVACRSLTGYWVTSVVLHFFLDQGQGIVLTIANLEVSASHPSWIVYYTHQWDLESNI